MSRSRALAAVALVALSTACTMYGARIQVERAGAASAFTLPEQARARAIVLEICRAERFTERSVSGASSGGYVTFVSLTGKGSEHDTVGVSGQIADDRRVILVSVGDSARGEPLPRTQQLVDDLRAALARAFPESRVEVTRHDESKLFGP
jgi:hypothetical protein